METKLTLRLDKKIIEQIKVYALLHKLSVSGLTENLYRQLLQSEDTILANELGPIAQKYKGIIKNKNMDTGTAKLDYLREKHIG